MKTYPDYIPSWLSDRFESFVWHKDRSAPVVYLTFDDGPAPLVTDFVLDTLDAYDFKATFFCIGDCVQQHPFLYARLQEKGHNIGNHTQNHLNGWKVDKDSYLENVSLARKHIDSTLFRPPYGKLTPRKVTGLKDAGYTIVLWDVLSGDFDTDRTAVDILENLKTNTQPGSIIVLHDNAKCHDVLQEILPNYCAWIQSQGWTSKSLT